MALDPAIKVAALVKMIEVPGAPAAYIARELGNPAIAAAVSAGLITVETQYVLTENGYKMLEALGLIERG